MDAPQVSGSAASYAKKGALANLFLIDDGSSDPDSLLESQLSQLNQEQRAS
ncbi:ERF family protein [Lactobacillus gasseri]|uniref:ERF family protein n=1 Tax=Lactobacillus gasseri TaxID=1596 RepID=UPI001587DE0A|nr:ERF family protein [Lactobacillus gasseri]